MRQLIRKAIDYWNSAKAPQRDPAKSLVEKVVGQELNRLMPKLIEEALFSSFERRPNKQLNAIGFKWALVLYFEKYWPDITRPYSISCAEDCLEVPHGTSGYDWSASSAKELVLEYVAEYGEAA